MTGHKGSGEGARCEAEQEALGYLHCQRQRRLKGEFEGQHKDFKEVFQLRPLAAGNRCPHFNFLMHVSSLEERDHKSKAQEAEPV